MFRHREEGIVRDAAREADGGLDAPVVFVWLEGGVIEEESGCR